MRTALLAVLLACLPALAAEDSVKKTTDGFGGLLRGMGQEIKKGSDAVTSGSKKDGKKKEEKK